MRRLALGMTVALVGCFEGETTLGASCREDADCGAEQRCNDEVCGYCGDGLAQPGELCTVPAVELETAPRASAGTLLGLDHGRDGIVDLVGRGADGTVELWIGDGRGGLAVGTRVMEGGRAGPVRLAELDEDGRMDLVVVDAEAGTLAYGIAEDVPSWRMHEPVALGGTPVDLAVAGAGGEGGAWVAWVDERGLWQATMDVPRGGLFEAVQRTEARTQWIGDPARLDEDGALDLVVVDVEGRALEPWWGDGQAGLVRGETIAIEGRATAVEMLDVDGDGDVDVLVPDEEGGVTVLVSDAQGELVSAGRVTVPGPARSVVVADLDRDADRDLVVVADHASPLWALRQRGGRFPDPIALPVRGSVGAVVAADVDRDGLVELVLAPGEGVGTLRVVEVEP